MNECFSSARAHAYARGALPGDEASAIEDHASDCPRCEGTLREASADANLEAELRAVRATDASSEDELVAGFELFEELHSGGQGTVYRARQVATQREVAVKLMRAVGARERYRFEREIELSCRLEHPGIVTVHASGVAGERAWYAMELVRGRRLDRWVEAERPDLRRRLELFEAVADAVAYAHRRGVIHRDLKPANVLVDDEGRPRLLDFGIAAPVGERLRITATGEFMGTLLYASPEQLQGDNAALDTRTDVYSLGVILFELVTGEAPYDDASSVSDAVANIASGTLRDPSRLSGEVDGDLCVVLRRALARQPDERYSSVEAFATDVRRWRLGEPIEARRSSAWHVLRKALLRQRGPLLLAGVAAVAVAAAAVGVFTEHLRAERQRESLELVRAVFEDVIGAASPGRMGGDVRLVEVLQAVGPSIDADLAAAPDVQAAVQMAIGNTYRRLLMYPEAELHLSTAAERMRQAGDTGERYAECLHFLAVVRASRSDPRARESAREALELRERLFGPTDPRTSLSRRILGIAHLDGPRSDAAKGVALVEQALRELERTDDELAVARVKIDLGRILREPERATRLLEESLATFAREAPEDPASIHAHNALATRAREAGDYDRAREHLDRSTELARRLYGEDRMTEMMQRYAWIESARGETDRALELHRRGVQAELDYWARRRPEHAPRLRELSERFEGDDPGPRPWSEVYATFRSFRGSGAFEVASWANEVSRLLLENDRAAEAEAALREALPIFCRAFGPDCPVRQNTIELLTSVLVSDGRCDEAVPLLEESIATSERNEREDGELYANATARLAVCCEEASPTR